jgi:hypothetical protein
MNAFGRLKLILGVIKIRQMTHFISILVTLLSVYYVKKLFKQRKYFFKNIFFLLKTLKYPEVSFKRRLGRNFDPRRILYSRQQLHIAMREFFPWAQKQIWFHEFVDTCVCPSCSCPLFQIDNSLNDNHLFCSSVAPGRIRTFDLLMQFNCASAASGQFHSMNW